MPRRKGDEGQIEGVTDEREAALRGRRGTVVKTTYDYLFAVDKLIWRLCLVHRSHFPQPTEWELLDRGDGLTTNSNSATKVVACRKTVPDWRAATIVCPIRSNVGPIRRCGCSCWRSRRARGERSVGLTR